MSAIERLPRDVWLTLALCVRMAGVVVRARGKKVCGVWMRDGAIERRPRNVWLTLVFLPRNVWLTLAM